MPKGESRYQHIAQVMDDLCLATGGEADVPKRMVLVASMGNHLRLDQTTYLAYEELADLICHHLKVVMWLGSFPDHVRRCLEQYPIIWFHDEANCFAFYWGYKAFYLKCQKLAMEETRIKLQ